MHVCASQGTYSHDMQDCDEFIIIFKESICAHNNSSLIPKYQGH